MGNGDRQVDWGRNGNKIERGRKVLSERRMNCASKEAVRGVVASCSESRSDGRKRSVRRMEWHFAAPPSAAGVAFGKTVKAAATAACGKVNLVDCVPLHSLVVVLIVSVDTWRIESMTF